MLLFSLGAAITTGRSWDFCPEGWTGLVRVVLLAVVNMRRWVMQWFHFLRQPAYFMDRLTLKTKWHPYVSYRPFCCSLYCARFWTMLLIGCLANGDVSDLVLTWAALPSQPSWVTLWHQLNFPRHTLARQFLCPIERPISYCVPLKRPIRDTATVFRTTYKGSKSLKTNQLGSGGRLLPSCCACFPEANIWVACVRNRC